MVSGGGAGSEFFLGPGLMSFGGWGMRAGDIFGI